MIRVSFISLLLITLSIAGMEQIELCPHRHAYYMQQKQNNLSNVPKVCPFCDEKTLEKNRIISKDHQVMIIENINPYFMQGFHWMLLPIEHKKNPADFSRAELAEHVEAMLKFSAFFYKKSFHQQFVAALGLLAGQSQEHWHTHLKAYLDPAVWLSEREERDAKLREHKPDLIALQSEWNAWISHPDKSQDFLPRGKNCDCCLVINNINEDKRNFVIKRFKHNIVCFPKIPKVNAQVMVIPTVHIHAFKQLSREAATENIFLTMRLLPKLQQYASVYIAHSDGGSWLISGMGAKQSIEEKQNHHIYTTIAPSTDMPISPGTLMGETCKLDYNPTHLYTYLQEQVAELEQ